MLQRAMSVRPDQTPAPNFINRLLGANFAAMSRDEATLRTFLQVRVGLDACLGMLHKKQQDHVITGLRLRRSKSLNDCALQQRSSPAMIPCPDACRRKHGAPEAFASLQSH